MKKLKIFAVISVLMLALAGCGNSKEATEESIYSFSGESDELRIINGIAVIGGENETLYGGELEIKDGDFSGLKEYDMNYFVSDGGNKWTLMSMISADETGGTFEVKNQKVGMISGSVFSKEFDMNTFKNGLYFELTTIDKDGNTETYRVPMKVKEVISAIEE